MCLENLENYDIIGYIPYTFLQIQQIFWYPIAWTFPNRMHSSPNSGLSEPRTSFSRRQKSEKIVVAKKSGWRCKMETTIAI